MTTESKSLVFLLPNGVLASDNSKLLKLKNPLTRVMSYFLLDEANQKLYEIQGFDETYRSWFINGSVHSDGCIKLATTYNPVFLILPYLIQATKNSPLDQLLDDDQCPEMRHLADIVDDLSCVADRIGMPSLDVWSYNETSTLNWLSKKVDKLSDLLAQNKERTLSNNAVLSDQESYRIMAFGILSEYLCEELHQKLKDHLKITQLEQQKKEDGTMDHSITKKAKAESDSNLLSSNQVKKTKSKPSSKEKALAKSAKGSKSITSFFLKK